MTAHATPRPTGGHATPAPPQGAAGDTRPATDGLVAGEAVALGGAQPPAFVLPAPPVPARPVPASRTEARAAVLPGAPGAHAAGLPTPAAAGVAPVEALVPPAPPVEAFVVPVPDVADPVVPSPAPRAAAAPEPEAPVPAGDAPAVGELRPRAVVGTVPIPAPAPRSPAPYVRAVRLAPGVADASGVAGAGAERRAAVSVRPVRLPLDRPADPAPTAPPTTRTTEEPQP
ncbi:hypothetical protein ABZZ37_17565 [Streptomyces sp. NPDC006464]|uniref:hypothetical protein n=1 Tax=Streptomyces sp. NPDC006464 TaxID=3154305 RepID=UPI0033AB8335